MLPHELVRESLRSRRDTAGLARMLNKSMRRETDFDYAMFELSTPVLPDELAEAAITLNEFVASQFTVDCYAGPRSGDSIRHMKHNMKKFTEDVLIQAGDDAEGYIYPGKNREWESSYWVSMDRETRNLLPDIYLAESWHNIEEDPRGSAYTMATYKGFRRKDVLVSLKMIRHIYQRRLDESQPIIPDVLDAMVLQYLRRSVRQLSDLGLVFAYSWLLVNRMDLRDEVETEHLKAEHVTQEVIDELVTEIESLIISS